jgi:hypothetical protein
VLDHCYHQDDDLTQQLLTASLENWSRQTCLSLGRTSTLCLRLIFLIRFSDDFLCGVTSEFVKEFFRFLLVTRAFIA